MIFGNISLCLDYKLWKAGFKTCPSTLSVSEQKAFKQQQQLVYLTFELGCLVENRQ
jgi:hypothetical protein